jgi:hypothetical protein
VERNVQKNGLVNLVAAALIFVAAFVAAAYARSLAGQVGAVFLGLGMLVAFIGWFQMRLEENERLERLEFDELARAKGGSALFETKESEVFPARRSREQCSKNISCRDSRCCCSCWRPAARGCSGAGWRW